MEEKQQNPEQTLPDEKVLKLSLSDPSHFGFLVEKYQTPFLRKALGVVRGREEAEDVVQETFVKIYKYGHKFKKEAGIEFKSWAYKILMNTAFTHYQKLKKSGANVEYLDTLINSELPLDDGKDLAAISDAKATVNAVLEKMPEHLARVLKLYYLDDKPYKEIVTIEKISTAALKMRLFRAKRLFQKLSTDA